MIKAGWFVLVACGCRELRGFAGRKRQGNWAIVPGVVCRVVECFS